MRWLVLAVLLSIIFLFCKSVENNLVSFESDFIVSSFRNLDTSDLEEIYCPDSTVVSVGFMERYLEFRGKVYDKHITAKYDNRDDLIYTESCFEIFFDPDVDGENYYEIQINAKGTIYDKIIRRYDGFGSSDNVQEWTIKQELVHTDIHGTLNNNTDEDKYWTFDMKIPWRLIREGKPEQNSTWAFNFMRVDADGKRPKHWVMKTTGKNKSIHTSDMWELIKVDTRPSAKRQ